MLSTGGAVCGVSGPVGALRGEAAVVTCMVGRRLPVGLLELGRIEGLTDGAAVAEVASRTVTERNNALAVLF